jgi:hypothetical protein
MSLRSFPGMPPARRSNDHLELPSINDMMLAQATRASAPPMLMRRTLRSLSSSGLRAGRIVTTFTGFGATALTMDAISPFSRTPGAVQAVRGRTRERDE